MESAVTVRHPYTQTNPLGYDTPLHLIVSTNVTLLCTIFISEYLESDLSRDSRAGGSCHRERKKIHIDDIVREGCSICSLDIRTGDVMHGPYHRTLLNKTCYGIRV